MSSIVYLNTYRESKNIPQISIKAFKVVAYRVDNNMNTIKIAIPSLAIMLMVSGGMVLAQETPGEELDGKIGPVGVVNEVNNRDWANTPEQIREHEDFARFIAHEQEDNYLNNERKAASIIVYNIETQIGKDIRGYELAALVARLQIINETYSPTNHERKMHEWASFTYDVPEDEAQVDARISEITNNADAMLVYDLIDGIHRLVNIGSVSEDLKATDPQYWFFLSVRTACEHDPGCDVSKLPGMEILSEIPDPRVINVGNYGFHWGHIDVQYKFCQGEMQRCVASHSHQGTGILRKSFSSPEHIVSSSIYLEMFAYGTSTNPHAVVIGQVIEPIAGSTLIGSSDGGYVTKAGTITNPNARAQTYIEIAFKSYVYS